MATISSLSGTQSAAQAGVKQLRLQQARRTAEQAEQTARVLSAAAQEARQQASEAVETARAISAQSDQAQVTAGQARQGLASMNAVTQMQVQLTKAVTQVAQAVTETKPAPVAKSSPSPVVNTEGHVTGTVVNTTA